MIQRCHNQGSDVGALQKQLNNLKMKVLKVSRMSRGEEQGLIDSGVTHPFRPVRGDEDFKTMKDVVVTLASGERKTLKMTRGGCLVTLDQETEPIIPMGASVVMGCETKWTGSGFEIHHRLIGQLEGGAQTTGCS